MSDAHAKPLYYGWKIVAAILFTLTFSSGLSFYNHSIYLNALAATPAFTVQTASVAVSLFFFSGGLAGLWVARWVQHYDPRYAKHRARIEVRLAEVDAGSLRPETLPDTAARVAGAVQALL